MYLLVDSKGGPRGGVVSIATVYGPEGLGLESRQGHGEFSFVQNAQTGCGAHPGSHSVGAIPPPPRGTATSASPVCLDDACRLNVAVYHTQNRMPSRKYLPFIARNMLGA